MATEIWVNIGSGNGLLPDGTKPLSAPMLTDHQWSPSDIHNRSISQKMPQPSITKICLNITYLNIHSNFPGPNELSKENMITGSLYSTGNTICLWKSILDAYLSNSRIKLYSLTGFHDRPNLKNFFNSLEFCARLETNALSFRCIDSVVYTAPWLSWG